MTMAFETDIRQEAQATTERPSPEVVHRLLERAGQVHVWNAHEGLDLSLDALEVSETLSYRRGLAASMALCAKCHAILGDYTRALAEAETALKLFDSDNDTESFADCQCTLADVYSLMGDFFHALHLLEETSRTSPSISPKTKARILFTQGGVYQALADYAKALAHHNESLLVCTDAGDVAGRATALSSIGSVYSDLGEYATAISFYRQSLSIYQEVEDKGGEAWTLERMGTLCTRMGGLEDALAFHHRSLVLRRDANNHRGVAGCLFYIGEILSKQGLEEQAIVMFN
ncbi:MAG: tetratricopeptide repeat protein, partial [Candidatus Kapaibacterium sp.]